MSQQYSLHDSTFLLGATAPDGFPESDLPECAFIGRSNAGKSTLVNRLTNSTKLAHVSSQPGKTREINFFSSKALAEGQSPFELMLVDLPGYGYAKFSKSQREALSSLTVEYLAYREQLRVVCLIHDSRRLTIGEEERALQKLLFDQGRHLIVVVSKCDKLKQKEKAKNIKLIAKAYGLEQGDVVLAGLKQRDNALLERVVMLCGL